MLWISGVFVVLVVSVCPWCQFRVIPVRVPTYSAMFRTLLVLLVLAVLDTVYGPLALLSVGLS